MARDPTAMTDLLGTDVPVIASRGTTDGASTTAAFVLTGQVAGRIDAVRPVAEIIDGRGDRSLAAVARLEGFVGDP